MSVEDWVTLVDKMSTDSCVVVKFLVIATIEVRVEWVLFDFSIEDTIPVVVQLFVIIVPNVLLLFDAEIVPIGIKKILINVELPIVKFGVNLRLR